MPHHPNSHRILAPAIGAALALLGAGRAGAQDTAQPARHGAAADTSFAELQRRGKEIMGVDQYTSVHQFDALRDGGRIELRRAVDDPDGTRTIRKHLRTIAAAFRNGDFGTPAMVHLREVPGTRVMAAKRAAITYTVRDLPRGGELRMKTSDPDAIAAIHEFMAFQRGEHHAGGKGDPMGAMHAHDSAMHDMGAGEHPAAPRPDTTRRPHPPAARG